MCISALIIFILLIVCCVIYSLTHHKLKKYLRMQSKVWIVICVVWFCYMLFIWIDWALINGVLGKYGKSDVPTTDTEKGWYYTIYGDVAYTAICNFIATFLPIAILINKKLGSYFVAIGILPGLLVLFSYIFKKNYDDGHNFLEGIFYLNNGSIFKHFGLFFISYLFLFNCQSFVLRDSKRLISCDVFYQLLIILIYICYVIAITYIGNACWVPTNRQFINTSGLFSQDYGQYSVYNTIKFIPYPLSTILVWLAIIGSSYFVQFIFSYMKKKYKKYFLYIK